MRSLLSQLVTAVVILALVPGCSLTSPDSRPVSVQDVLASREARGVVLDASQIPSYDAVRSTVTPLLSDVAQPLTAAECACRAAAASRTAAVLETEAAHACQLLAHPHHGVSELLPAILRDQARRARNDAARDALVAYYQLAEVELQQEVVAESYEEHKSAQATIDGLHAAGLAANFDRSALERQRLALDQQSLQLMHDQARLTGLIKSLTGADPLSPESMETTCTIEPRAPEYGLQEALEIARANDVELRALRRFLNGGSVDDLEVARSLLQTTSPLMGQVPTSLGLLAKLRLVCGLNPQGEKELPIRKRQIAALYEARQQQVDLQVANDLIHAQDRFLATGVAKDVLDSWERRIALLESNREVQKSNYADLMAARAERLQARSDLLHKVIELEIAHVRVQGALGILADDCPR